MAEFVYNPAESIKQGFQQTSEGLGSIFTQIIAQQQRDFNLAESAFQNIEALKKDVNIFGQKSITSKSNDLLKQAGSAILKDGKLDYSKLGEIRQSISDIKDLKAGYDVGAKEYERMLQLGIANKDNLVSFEKFYKDLSSKMSDENLVKNPQDLQKAMADTYTNNLDTFTMFNKSYLKANPYKKITQDITDPKTKALMRVQGELPANMTIDAQGNKVMAAPITTMINGQTITMDYADQELARIQSSEPDRLALMKKQAGFPGQNLSDKDLVKFYIDRVPANIQATQVSSADELKLKRLSVEAAEFKVANQGQEFAQEMKSKRLANRLTEAQIDALEAKTNSQTKVGSNANIFEAAFPKIKGGKEIGETKAKATDLGMVIPMIVPTTNGNKNLNVKQIFYDANGNARVAYIEEISAVKKEKSRFENLSSVGATPFSISDDKATKSEVLKYATIPKAKVNAFASSLKSNLRAKYKDDKDYADILNNVQGVFTEFVSESVPITSTVTYTKAQLLGQGYSESEIQQIVSAKRAEGIEIIIK